MYGVALNMEPQFHAKQQNARRLSRLEWRTDTRDHTASKDKHGETGPSPAEVRDLGHDTNRYHLNRNTMGLSGECCGVKVVRVPSSELSPLSFYSRPVLLRSFEIVIGLSVV